MGEDVDHAGDAQRFAGIDAADVPLRYGGPDDISLNQSGDVELAGISGLAGDLGPAVDAGGSCSDIGCHGAHRIFLTRLRLRGAACGLAQRSQNGAPGQPDLEAVMPIAPGALQQQVRGSGECALASALSAQGGFGRGIAPGLVRDATQRQAGLLDRVAFKFERRCHRDQCERIGQAVADLQVRVVRVEALRRKLDGRDDLAGLQIGVALRRVAGQPMEIRKCDDPGAVRTGDMHFRLERRERDAHIGWMRCDAGLARTQNGVDAVDAVDRRAAAARRAFVAGRHRVVEVKAPRALHEVAPGRCHVAQLLRRAGQDRAREQRISMFDQRVIGEVGIRHQRPDEKAAVQGFLDVL